MLLMLWMGSSHRHRERLLAVPSGLIEQHDGVGVPRAAPREAIKEYAHGVGIDLGEDEREGIVSGRPPGGLEVGGNARPGAHSPSEVAFASVVIQAAASRMRRTFITLRKPDESIEHNSNDQEPKLYE